MKKSISILFILLGCSVFSQDIVFNNVFIRNTPVIRNVLVLDNGYVVAGGDYNSSWKVEILIAKFDEFGDLVWTKSYGDETYDYYHGERNSLISNSDGGYSLSGHRTNPTNGNRACMLTKFDQNFDTLWTRLYFDNPDFTAFYNHIQTPDGGYALVGSNDETDPDGDVLLVKTDSEGNMEWYKKYGTNELDMGISIVNTDDGGYLIGGAGNGNNYLIKTDLDGNLQWSEQYGHTTLLDGSIVQILRTKDMGYLLVSRETLYSQGSSTVLYYGKGSLKKLDIDFNEEWYRLYGETGYQTAFGSCVETSDGRLVLTLMEGVPNRSKILFLSAEGDSIRKIDYVAEGSTLEQWLLTIKQTPDNGFIMAGVAYDPQVMWLVKTDSCGCVVEDCECGGSAVVEVLANGEIEVYPNPAKEVLYFNLPENTKDVRVEIYDNLGRLLITNELLGWENSVDVKQLKSGNYFVRIIGDVENWSGWFVKE